MLKNFKNISIVGIILLLLIGNIHAKDYVYGAYDDDDIKSDVRTAIWDALCFFNEEFDVNFDDFYGKFWDHGSTFGHLENAHHNAVSYYDPAKYHYFKLGFIVCSAKINSHNLGGGIGNFQDYQKSGVSYRKWYAAIDYCHPDFNCEVARLTSGILHEFTHQFRPEDNCSDPACVMSTEGAKSGNLTYCSACSSRIERGLVEAGIKSAKKPISQPITKDVLPEKLSLEQNYPNPFNPTTTITYALPKEGNVNISVYNINGKLVQTLVNEYKEAGNYNVAWEANSVVSGVYFYRITAGGFTETKRMLLVK